MRVAMYLIGAIALLLFLHENGNPHCYLVKRQSRLRDFSEFFLQTCIDQVEFMGQLLDPTELLRRMEIWCEEEIRAKRLKRGSWQLLMEAVIAGGYARGKAADITGYEVRQARTVLSELLDRGLLVSAGHRAEVRLGFPLEVVERWFPRLYIAG
jgi:Fic family protein